jgi:hypothetical protein
MTEPDYPHGEIIVRVDRNYGKQVVYPVCSTAQRFAELAETATLTPRAIDTIKALGFRVRILCEERFL